MAGTSEPMNASQSEIPAPGDVPPAPLAGTRSEAIQRLQIGLFGLSVMVMMVGLANIVMERAKQAEAAVNPQVEETLSAEAPAKNSDPLADAGVVPELPADPEPDADAAPPLPTTGNPATPPSTPSITDPID